MAKERWPRPPVIFVVIAIVSCALFYFACRRLSYSLDKWNKQREAPNRFFTPIRPQEETKEPIVFDFWIKLLANFAKDYILPDFSSIPITFAKVGGLMFVCLAISGLGRIVQFVKSFFPSWQVPSINLPPLNLELTDFGFDRTSLLALLPMMASFSTYAMKHDTNYLDTQQMDEWMDDSYIPLLCGPKDGQITIHRRTPSFANVFPEYRATVDDDEHGPLIYSSRMGSSGDDRDYDVSDEETQRQNIQIPDILTIMKHMPKTVEAADVYLDAFERLAVKLGKTDMVALIRDAQTYLDKRRKNLTGDQAPDDSYKYSYVMKRVDAE